MGLPETLLTMETDFLKKAWQHFRDHHLPGRRQWRGCLFGEIQQAPGLIIGYTAAYQTRSFSS
jgi:hypothetical protein